MATHLIVPLRKELHEVQDDIQKLIKGEITQIQHLNQTVAYSIIGLLCLKNAEVFPIGMTWEHGMIYSVVLIDGRLA